MSGVIFVKISLLYAKKLMKSKRENENFHDNVPKNKCFVKKISRNVKIRICYKECLA
jgi:hypothetical protein